MEVSAKSILLTVLTWILAFVVVEIFRLTVWEWIVKRECNCKDK